METVTWRKWIVLAGLAQCVALSCVGDDTFPACWRGQPGTTYQQWTFSTAANPASPVQFSNPYGIPQATVTPGIAAAGWLNQLAIPFGANRTGYWDLGNGGFISLVISNQAHPVGSWKYVHVQVTQYRDAFYSQLATVDVPGATFVRKQLRTNETVLIIPPSGQPFPGGSWVVEQSVWLMEPCPASETVKITAGTKGAAIDQVVVDTQCKTGDGGDKYAPCWRGDSGSTFQNWSFHNGASPAAPEEKIPPGAPQATLLPGPSALGWRDELPGFGCHQGYWDLGNGGTMTLNIPNVPGLPTAWKYVRVQVVQFQAPLTYNQLATVLVPGATFVSQQQQPLPLSGESPGSWVVHQTVWRFEPCPNMETVVITAPASSALIDQVIVDTLCQDFACPPDQGPYSADPDLCGKTNISWTLPAVDLCTVTGVLCDHANPGTFPVGATTVNCTITDAQGGIKNCMFTVEIIDGKADVQVQVTAAPNPIVVGNELSYTMTVKNNGPCDATGVMLNFLLSPDQTLMMARNGAAAPFMACPNPGPSAWWRAEGNASDSAGLNHGTIHGGVTYIASEVGQGFNMDGVDDYVSVPDAPALQPASFTIEGWIQIGDPNGVRVIVSKPQGAGSDESFSVWIASGVLHAAISDAGGSGPFLACSIPQSSDRHHIAFSFDDATKVQALHLNGALVDLGIVNKTIAYDSHPLRIGAGNNAGSPDYFFQGEIDELSLYNRALAGTEIEPIHRMGADGKCAAPGPFALGALASGAMVEVTLVVSPTGCGLASDTATVTSASVDPNGANDTAAASSLVQDLPNSQWLLTIERASMGSDRLRICWPAICGPYVLESTGTLDAPIPWTPFVPPAPVQVIGNRTCTIVLPSDPERFYRLVRP